MDDRLKERKNRGALLDPLEVYRMESGREPIFVPYHWHGEIEAVCVTRGDLSLTVDGERYRGTAGDLFWIGPEALHGMEAPAGPTRYLALVFPMEYLSFERLDSAQSRYLGPLCRGEAGFPVRIPREGAHFREAFGELLAVGALEGEREPGYQIAVKASLLKSVGLLIRDGLLRPRGGEASSDFRMNRIKAVLGYIQRHSAEELSLSGVAGEFHLSPKYFSRFFRKNLGRSFVEYLNAFRIERSADLLLHTDLPVGEIALSVGFCNFSYYIRLFRRLHGCTPSRYRKQAGQPAMHRHATVPPGEKRPP